jgi:hypothetical protein
MGGIVDRRLACRGPATRDGHSLADGDECDRCSSADRGTDGGSDSAGGDGTGDDGRSAQAYPNHDV